MSNKDKLPRFLVILAITSAILALGGFVLRDPFWLHSSTGAAFTSFTNALYATLQTFVLEAPAPGETNGPYANLSWGLVNTARFLAPLSLAGALISALSGFWRPIVIRSRLLNLRRHTIIFGAGEVAEKFIRNALKAGTKTACFVTNESDKNSLEQEFGPGLLIHFANPTQHESWKNVSVFHAADIALVSPKDGENLAAMNLLKSVWKNQSSAPEPTSLFVHVLDETLRGELISQTGNFAGADGLEIQPVSVNELAARFFFHQNDFFYDTRNDGFSCVHWLIFGLSDNAIALIRQFLKVSAFAGLAKPHITLLVPDPVFARCLLEEMFGGQNNLANFTIHPMEEHQPVPDARLTQEIEEQAPVSAIYVALGSNEHNQKFATQLHGISTRTGHFKARVYLDSSSTKSNWLDGSAQEARQSQTSFQQLADGEEYCSLAFLNNHYDQAARAFHLAYSQSKSVVGGWQALDENFKQANRRAADHAKTKLESLGFIGPLENMTIPVGEHINPGPACVEQLAELEHQSWIADRLTNGWKYAPTRSNQKRLHPNLLPYEQLNEDEKALDRDQVRLLLDDIVKPGDAPTLIREIRIGLIGHNTISLKEAANIQSRLKDEILPALASAHKHQKLSFISPLAPGSDYVLTDTILQNFGNLHANWTFRDVCSMPREQIVEHYQHNWDFEKTWNGREANGLGKLCSPDWQLARLEISDRLAELVQKSPNYKGMIDLMPPYREFEFWGRETNAQTAFIRGAHYMAETVDILIAFLDPSRQSGVGGTGHSVKIGRERDIDVLLI